jgi:DNA-binding NtrC family response regulator
MGSNILFVSDSVSDAQRLSRILHPVPLVLDHVDGVQSARAKLRKEIYEIILTEATLPDGGWLDVLQLARDCVGQPEVIVTDPHADARFWSEILNMGAFDLIAQPFDEPEVRRILYNACSRLHAPVHNAVTV